MYGTDDAQKELLFAEVGHGYNMMQERKYFVEMQGLEDDCDPKNRLSNDAVITVGKEVMCLKM